MFHGYETLWRGKIFDGQFVSTTFPIDFILLFHFFFSILIFSSLAKGYCSSGEGPHTLLLIRVLCKWRRAVHSS